MAHFKEKDRATKTIQLKESTEQNYLQQIFPYIHVKTDRERGSIFKKNRTLLASKSLGGSLIVTLAYAP